MFYYEAVNYIKDKCLFPGEVVVLNWMDRGKPSGARCIKMDVEVWTFLAAVSGCGPDVSAA